MHPGIGIIEEYGGILIIFILGGPSFECIVVKLDRAAQLLAI